MTTQQRYTRGRRAVSFFAVVMCLGGWCSQAALAQWTQWGGANGDFTADSAGLANAWPTEGPRKIWSRDLGEGYSAILAHQGRLYTMYRENGKEIATCLDAGTGESIWEHRYEVATKPGHAKRFGEGPRSTPLLAGDRLFTIGVAGTMHCLDKNNGKVIWTHELWDEFGGNVLQHGYASSPFDYQDTVIILVGAKDAAVMALKKSDGSVVWKSGSFENSYSTPRLLRVDGQDQLVTFMATEMVGMDPNNGDIKWTYAHENQWKQNVCMPAMADEQHLFLSTTDAGSRGLKLTQNGHKTNVEEIWSSRKVQFFHITTVQQGDYVYGTTSSAGILAAINIRTGKLAWRKRGFPKATCVAVDGKAIMLDEDGQLSLLTLTPEGVTVHSQAKILGNPAWTVPTIVGKTAFLRDKSVIMALDLG